LPPLFSKKLNSLTGKMKKKISMMRKVMKYNAVADSGGVPFFKKTWPEVR
jgi:hypothetical protein